MEREQVDMAFRADFDDPGSLKSGEFLREHILERARRLVEKDRASLVEVLNEWLRECQEPHAMLAVAVAGDLGLIELQGSLHELKKKIISNQVFMPFYVSKVNAALARIGQMSGREAGDMT